MAGFYRMLFGGVVLLAALALLKGRLWQGKRHFLLSFCCSAIFTLDLVLWHRSIYYVGPGLATLLSGFQVFFFVSCGVFLLKEKVKPTLLFSLLLAIVGLYLMVGVDWHLLTPQYKWGVIFGLITALCYAAYVLILRRIQDEKGALSPHNLSTLALITLINIILMAGIALYSRESFIIPDAQSWLALLGYGLISQVLAWVLICAGIVTVPAAQISLILILQPSLSMIWDILFFQRPMPQEEILGVIMILAGLYLGTRPDRKPR
jgi:drug/metabolite transporter (DMT)-like permease